MALLLNLSYIIQIFHISFDSLPVNFLHLILTLQQVVIPVLDLLRGIYRYLFMRACRPTDRNLSDFRIFVVRVVNVRVFEAFKRLEIFTLDIAVVEILVLLRNSDRFPFYVILDDLLSILIVAHIFVDFFLHLQACAQSHDFIIFLNLGKNLIKIGKCLHLHIPGS
jgi:hypothetical protein